MCSTHFFVFHLEHRDVKGGNMGNTVSDRHRASYIPFRCDTKTEELIGKLAKEQKCTKSDILRDLIDKGLKSDGYKPEEDRAYTLVRAAVQEVMKPYVERLASISAKASQIAGADFFLLVYLGSLLLPPDERQRMDEAAARARQLGIEYLKIKADADIDRFIATGVLKVQDEE